MPSFVDTPLGGLTLWKEWLRDGVGVKQEEVGKGRGRTVIYIFRIYKVNIKIKYIEIV